MDIRSWITHKVRSQRGASLSMALLVALVCSVVASIVLSAATAVSGRQSQLAEMERSYYNVTSAARIFWDEMSKDSDGEGLAVNITRGCNAQKNASNQWDGWYLKIDGVAKTSVSGEGSSDTLFQIASYDLVMNKNGSLNFKTSHEVNGENISASFNDNGSKPQPKPASSSPASYEKIKFQAKKTSGESLNEVYVTVTRNGDETFDFEFREDGDSSYICTLTALVWASGGEMFPADDDAHLEGTASITWKPINMTVGVLGDVS
jgi:hypothetical protein